MKIIKNFFVSLFISFLTLSISLQQASAISPSALTCTSLSQNIKKGQSGGEVKKLQQFLFEKGYLVAMPKVNIFGPSTVLAIKSFQADNGIVKTGVLGKISRDKIKEMSCENYEEVLKINTKATSTEFKDVMTDKINFIEIGNTQNKYISAKNPLWINGKLAYVLADREAIPGTEKYYMVYDGKVIGKDYYTINRPFSLNNKLGYIASNNDKKNVLVYDGIEYDGKVYDTNLSNPLPVDINGKLAYLASKDNEYFIVYDGKEVSKKYRNISQMASVDGKLAYAAITMTGIKNTKVSVSVVYDGNEIGKNYEWVSILSDVNGKVAYVATKNSKTFVVYDGKEIKNDYSQIKNLTGINGKLAYLASKNSKWVAVYDGVEISKEYDEVFCMYDSTYPCLLDVKGKAAYIGIKNKKYFVVYDGKEIGNEYVWIGKLINVQGKLAYEAYKDSKTFIVYDGVEIGKEYFKASNPIAVNGKLSYIAIPRDAPSNIFYFIVMEK